MNGKSLFKERVGKKFSSSHFFLNTLLFCLTAQSICLAQGNSTIDSHPDVIRARNFSERALFDSSIFYYQKSALDFYRREEWQAYVHCKAKAGAYGNYLGTEFKINALKDLNEALSIYNQYRLPDNEAIGDLLYYLGQHYHFFYQATGWKEAINFYEKALGIRFKALGNPHEKIAECYLGVGDVYNYILMDYANAENYYQKALSILEDLPRGDYFLLVTAYYDLATTNKNEQDLDKALMYAQRCLNLIDNNLQISKDEFKESILTVISNIYSDKKEYILAIDYLKGALLINQAHENDFKRMICLNNLAENYLFMNNYSDAKACAKKAMLIANKSNSENIEMVAKSLLILSRIEGELGNVKSARKFLLDALAIVLNKYDNHSFIAELYYNLGKLCMQNNDLDSALQNFQKAIYFMDNEKTTEKNDFRRNPKVNNVGSDYLLFEILAEKGEVLERLYEARKDTIYLKISLDSYLKADSLFSLYREGLDNQNARMTASEKHSDLYEGLAATAWINWKNNDDDKSRQLLLSAIDKSKTRMMQDALTEAVAKNALGIPDSLVSANRNFNIQLTYFQHLRAKAEISSEQKVQIEEEIFKLTRAQEKSATIIREKFPAFARIKFGEAAVSYDDIRNWTAQKKILLIDFFWAEQALYACCISGNYFNCLKIETESLSPALMQFVSFISGDNGKLTSDVFFSSGYYIYQTLIAPFLSLPFSKIVIIPDGQLYYLPFEALPTRINNLTNFKNADYLLKHYTTSYAYNLYEVLSKIEKKGSDGKILGFSFSQNATNDFFGQRNNEQELPGSLLELNAISTLFKGVYLRGSKATETNFKMLAHDFDIIHLALHGRSDEKFQNQISLLFRKEKDSINDGILYPYEIYGLQLKARMAVLSACSSGIGHIYKGEGIVSLASAFSYAGCSTVTLSLWNVSDLQTTAIMKAFYSSLKEGKAIDISLQEAKLKYINESDEYSANPRYWAAFIVTGAADPIVSNKWNKSLIVLLGFFSLAIIIYYKRRLFS